MTSEPLSVEDVTQTIRNVEDLMANKEIITNKDFTIGGTVDNFLLGDIETYTSVDDTC